MQATETSVRDFAGRSEARDERHHAGEAIWHRVGVGLSISILAIAAFALYRLLRDIEPHKVIIQLQEKSPRTLLTAGAFVCVAYLMATFYDFFALRTIGRNDVPYGIAALAAFSAYTIGHNVGAMVFTAGAIRYRIYSACGLNLGDVGKIAFVTGLICWLGNAFVLGTGMSYAPAAASAVNYLPGWANRAVGLAALAIIAAYLVWLLPCRRAIAFSKLRIPLPNAPITLLQMAIVTVDLGAVAGAMYTVLPSHPAIDPIGLSVIFVAAFLLGFLSHSPGSLGVIEATMLLGLPQFEKEALLVSLLLFRILYNVLPFLLASVLLAIHEILLIDRAYPVFQRQRRRLARRVAASTVLRRLLLLSHGARRSAH